jgi:ATPase subunit of ABC transporter with duplicated ATPase domains
VSYSIVVQDLHFSWPQGDSVFAGLDFVVGPGRTGIVGANGSGKSTLLSLIAGRLTPQQGSIHVAGSLGYLRQDLTLDAAQRVDEVLGIAAARSALQAIERGETDAELYAAVGDDWNVDERALLELERLNLGQVDLDRRVGEVSGGEAVLLGLAAQFLRRPDVLLLDEPTNNLDLAARQKLYAAVSSWPGVLVIVSHDRALLSMVDSVLELRDGAATWYGGNYAAYVEAVAAEQETAERLLRTAEADVRRQQRDLHDARIKLDRRVRYGQKMWDNKREPKIIMNARKRQAQVSAGAHRNTHLEKLEQAREKLTAAEDAVRGDTEIRVDLPATEVPAGRTVLTVRQALLSNGLRADFEIRGPERVALLGPNGSGKTTLLNTIAARLEPVAGQVKAHVPVRYLPQRLDVLTDSLTVAENVAVHAPGVEANEIRSRLARFGFRGRRAEQLAGSLSGGERLRACLAALLLAAPAPQLLLLDEPTNNLDLGSLAELEAALNGYRGGILIASHDQPFLDSIGITRWLSVQDSTLTEYYPEDE